MDTKKDLYLLLCPVASSILCTPASAVPVKCVFSASEFTRGKRNCLSDDNLERETLLHKNKTYLFWSSKYLCHAYPGQILPQEFLYFGTTKTRTIELGLEVKLELKLGKQTA